MPGFTIEQHCDRIFNWRAYNLTPSALFELQENYTKEDIKKAHRRLQLQLAPDKNISQEKRVRPAFELLTPLRDYLNFTLDNNKEGIEGNVFYRYYVLGMNPSSDSIYDQLETRSKTVYDNLKIYQDTAYAQEIAPHIDYIAQLVKEHPELITYTYRENAQNFLSWIAGKTIVYCAAHWNQTALFKQLLELGANPAKKADMDPADTDFTMDLSPLDIAITNDTPDILTILQEHYGNPWLKDQLDAIISSGNFHDYESLLKKYDYFFPKELSDTNTFIQHCPLFIPALYRLGKITQEEYPTLIKANIIGTSRLYQQLTHEEKQDPYMVVALLAQDRTCETLRHVPFKQLTPAFCVALADVWPEEALKHAVSTALHRDKPPYNNFFNQSDMLRVLAFTLVISLLCAVAIHFWPFIVTIPVLAETTLVVLPMLEIVGLMLSALFGQKYLTEIYPERREINKILTENNFFKLLPAADDAQHTPPEQGQRVAKTNP